MQAGPGREEGAEEGACERRLEFSERTDRVDEKGSVWQAEGAVSAAGAPGPGPGSGSRREGSGKQAAGPRSSRPRFSTFLVSAPSQNLCAKNIPYNCCVLYVDIEYVVSAP